MFINKSSDGRNNVCGKNVAKYRLEMKISQKKLADRLQLGGLNVDKNAVQRMESGQRFITDIELLHLCHVLNKSLQEMFEAEEK